ncbi:hypothetical protein [[Clostridium] polysaccharolyticum]|uniref:hypothetical protein n=1 Tax=[Clostridium] polysaccharolyticum TaxID=29364 RepID=UPI000B8894F5|nr:hypothetical protein [[Clostridium] polysaccharolyticum]
MKRNVCFVELERNEFGLINAVQSLETAYLRDYLMKCDMKSSVYIEDSVPSVNDMAEDILSLSDDIIIFVVHKECEALATVAVNYLLDIEDVEVCVISDSQQLGFDDDVVVIYEDVEEKLVSMYGDEGKANEVSVQELSPYEDGILLTRDYMKYGIWLGSGKSGFRNIDVVKREINEVVQLHSSTSNEQKKTIPMKGCFICDIDYFKELILHLENADISGIVLKIPVGQNVLSCIADSSLQLNQVSLDIQLEYEMSSDELKILSELIESNKVCAIKIPADWLTSQTPLIELLLKAHTTGLVEIKPYGEVDSSKISEEIKQAVLINTMRVYYTFYNGYLKSRTGLYAGVKVDGYVHHLEVSNKDSLSNAQLLNEALSINSSIYLRNEKNNITTPLWYFDENGIAYVEDEGYNEYITYMKEESINPSNAIICCDNRIYVNNYAYVADADFRTYSYKEAKQKIKEIREGYIQNNKITYLIRIDDQEDFEIFLEDAKYYCEHHTFGNLPLIYAFMENSCRFVTQNRCCVEKLPRLKLDNNEGIHYCDLNIKDSGKEGTSLFEISHDCLVKKENGMQSKGCYNCPSSGWCAKCMELPYFVSDQYCDIIKKKAYILDYVTSSYIYSGLHERNPKFSDLLPDEIVVSNEFMFNLIPSAIESKVAPYFPKFTTLFICRDSYLLWTPVSTKYYNVSKQFAIVIELLLKRVEADSVPELLADILNLSKDESYEMTKKIFATLKKVGVLYRDIPFETK